MSLVSPMFFGYLYGYCTGLFPPRWSVSFFGAFGCGLKESCCVLLCLVRSLLATRQAPDTIHSHTHTEAFRFLTRKIGNANCPSVCNTQISGGEFHSVKSSSSVRFLTNHMSVQGYTHLLLSRYGVLGNVVLGVMLNIFLSK